MLILHIDYPKGILTYTFLLFDFFPYHQDDELSSTRGGLQQDRYDEEDVEGDYSDADDFIVDDEGRPIADKRKKRKIFSDA